MRSTQSLVLASTNRDKFEEFEALLEAYPEIELLEAESILSNAEKIGFVEKHDTYLENALAKARLASNGCHFPILADDSGLEVEALGGKPGARSHRFSAAKKEKSQAQSNIDFLLSQIPAGASLGVSMKARFVCTLVLIVEGIAIDATGVLDGELIREQRGTQGFGYDPIFVPAGQTGTIKTLAEYTFHEKNEISHRAKALRALMDKVRQLGIVLAKP